MKRLQNPQASSQAAAARHDQRNGRVVSPPPLEAEDVRIARLAAIYCLHHFPMLWTAGLPRWEKDHQRWLVPVVVRYPTGHGGELGQLAYDGKEFTPLTERAVMAERAQAIEQEPTLRMQWHEQFAPPVPPGRP